MTWHIHIVLSFVKDVARPLSNAVVRRGLGNGLNMVLASHVRTCMR